MVKVYIARDTSQAHFVRDLLAREGLRAVVLGDNLQMAIGGVPAVANALPAIWVHPDDQAAAGAVIARMERGGERDRLRAQGPWQCPRCGEMLGPQFTECWNCGASRPSEGAEQVHPPPSSAHEVNLDAPCSRCQYNLRGLTTAQCCPECGRPIVASLMTFLDDQPAEQLPHLNESLRAPIEAALRGTEYPPDAVLFLMDAWPRALRRVQGQKNIDASDLCRSIVQFATTQMRNGVPMLRQWKLNDCQKLGRSLFVLIDHALVEKSDVVRPEEFPQTPIESLFPPS